MKVLHVRPARRQTLCPRSWRQRLAMLLVMSACFTSSFAAAASTPPLTIAVLENTFAAPVYIAETKGYFAAEGLDLKLERCNLGRVCMEMLLAGKVRFATSADAPLMLAALRRTEFAILATTTTSSMENLIVVREDRGLRTPADLKGRRIGAVKGTSSHYFMTTYLTHHGLTASDVTIAWIDPKDISGPLLRAEIDAAALFGTQVHDALRQLGVRGATLPPLRFFNVMFNVAGRAGVAGRTDEDAVKLLRALKRADDLIRNDPEQAITLVAAALRADRATLEKTWRNYEFRLHLGQGLVDMLESQVRWVVREKMLPAGARVPDFLDIIDTAPLRRVDARAVRLIQ